MIDLLWSLLPWWHWPFYPLAAAGTCYGLRCAWRDFADALAADRAGGWA